MSLCPYAYLRVSLSGSSTASDPGSLTTTGELFNISALDPLLPTLLITTLCLCVLLTILYYSLAIAWEVFWATRQSPSLLDPSAEVVLTLTVHCCYFFSSFAIQLNCGWVIEQAFIPVSFVEFSLCNLLCNNVIAGSPSPFSF